MKLETAKRKLLVAREQYAELRKEIDRLSDIIRNAGEDPPKLVSDLVERNKKIYVEWKRGKSFAALARELNLSSTTIASVCHRIEAILENRGRRFKIYKEMLKFK